MARNLFGGSSDDYAVDTYGKPVTSRRVRFYTSAAMTTEITDLASDAAGTGSPLTVTTDSHGFWGPVYGPDAVTVMYAGAVDVSGNPPLYVVAVYTHTTTVGGVSSFNTRTGAITLAKADVTGTGLAAADVGADATGAAATVQTNLTTEVTRAQAAEAALGGGMQFRTAVVVATTNQALSGLPTVDGVTLTAGQVILLTGQTAGSQNGLWAVAVGAWARPSNFAAGADATATSVLVESGTTGAGTTYAVTGTTSNVIGTNVLTFVKTSGTAASVGVKDEGTTVVAAVANVNFVGAGVTASDGGGGTATVTIPGVPSNSGYFYATSYGVVADGKSLADGAMTNGSAVLTSATAGFTLADVGKLVVVCNAKGAAHLYGTIAGFTNSTTVTLSTTATATVSAADFSYGTDDTANWLSCVAAAKAAKGTAILPPAMVCVTASTVIDSSFGITGPGCLASDAHMAPVAGAWNATNGSIAACNIPTKAPYLAGSQLLVMAANVDGIQITCPNGSLTVPLSGFGIRFAGMFTATGHGIVQTAAALAAGTPTQTGFDQGLMHTLWSDLKVFGHSGSKFAYKILNPLLNTFIQCHAFGGGGWQIEAYSSIVNQGNCVWIHPYICTVAGGIGYDLKLTGGSLNLLSFIRPQAINGTANLGSVWSGFSGIAAMTYTWQDNGAGGVSLISPDFEGPSTHVTAPGGGDYFITADALIANGFYNDNGPNPAIAVDFKRTFLTDLSFRLSQAEASGSTMKQLDDRVSAVLWGITTDGTVQNLRPGTTRHTGSTPSVTSGVAVGSGAPPCVVAGADSAGRAIFGSGTSTAAGAIASFTFARVMHTGAVVKLQANNSATQALGLYISALSTTGFTVSCATAPTASQAVTTYDFSWVAEDSTAVPVAPVVYDNFNRADNASVVGSPQLGSAPTVLTGTWGISSNQLYCSAGGGHVMWDAGKADATWQFKWSAAGVPSQEGITFRATDDSNFWLAAMDGTLYKRVAGSFTTVTTYTTPAAGDTISVVTLGSSIKVFKNGTQIASVTDAALSTGTHVGFRTNTASAFRADNLQVS